MKTIVAVAIGPNRYEGYKIDKTDDLKDSNVRKVRRYLHGLVDGLIRRGYRFGTNATNPRHFAIDFHLTNANGLSSADTFKYRDGSLPNVIFCMSTRVVKAAGGLNLGVPIVGIVSEPTVEGFDKDPFCGVSARRVQQAGACFRNFRLAVPQLQNIIVLGNSNYDVSNRALVAVDNAAQAAGFPYTVLNITDPSTIVSILQNDTNVPTRDTSDPTVPNGLLVLPVDMFLGSADKIIATAHGKGVPTFFPVTDYVKLRRNPALGGYGVPQRRCGVLMAEQVHHILSTGNMPTTRWIEAPDYDFEFLTSADAAADLGITLGPDIPAPED